MQKTSKIALGFVAGTVALTGSIARAADGTWIYTAGGLRYYDDTFSAPPGQNPDNWASGTVADGAGSIADFNTANIATDTFINVQDTDPVIGKLIIGDSDGTNNYRFQNGQLLMNNGASDAEITINVLSSSFAVFAGDAPLNVGGTGNLKITNNDHNIATPTVPRFVATIGGNISGSGDVIKSGVSPVLLTGVGTYAGNTYVTEGTLISNNDFDALPATTNLILSSGTNYQALDASIINGVHGNGYIWTSGSQITMGTYTGFINNTIILGSGGEMRPGDTNPAAPGTVGTLSLSQPSIPFNYFEIRSGSDTYLDFASLASYDQINVFRAAGADSPVLGGNLHLNFLNGFSPIRGDTFDVFVGFTGTQFIDPNGGNLFDSITSNILGGDYTASIIQGSSDTLRITVLPEPSIAGVVMCGGMLAVGRRRRSETR